MRDYLTPEEAERKIHSLPVPGTRVRLTVDVDRYPHFIAPKGSTGTVQDFDSFVYAVKMDDKIDGAEEWDNDIHFYIDYGDDPALYMEVAS